MESEETIPIANTPIPIFGVLTKNKLKELKILVGEKDDPNEIYEECYSNASFDFTLGDEYFFPKQYHDALLEAAKKNNLLDTDDLTEETKKEILRTQIRSCAGANGVLRIPKFSSVVISTYEKVHVPDNVAGRFDLRVKWALAGLVLQVGAQIEPGYKGRLWGLLHNFSGEDILISYHHKEQRLLTGEFYYTCEDAPPEERKLKKPLDLLGLLTKYPVKSGSLQNYFDEIQRLQVNLSENVETEIKSITNSRAAFKDEVNKKVDAELALIQTLKGEVEKTISTVQILSENVFQRRIVITNVVFVIVGLALSVGLPIYVQYRFNTNYDLIDQSKELKKRMDTVFTKVDTLNARNARFSDSLKAMKKTETEIRKELELFKAKKT